MALGATLAESRRRVVVVETDPQGSASWWADRAGENLPFTVVHDEDPQMLARLRDVPGYDLVLVDTPGSLEGADVLRAALSASDFAVLVTEPESLAVIPTLRTAKALAEPLGVPYRVLFTKVDRSRGGEADLANGRELLDAAGVPHFLAYARQLKVHSQLPLDGEVVTQSRRPLANQACQDYRQIALELFLSADKWPGRPAALAAQGATR